MAAVVGRRVGAEGGGLSRLVAETCDQLVSIPMANDLESLNAGVAASVTLYAIAQVREALPARIDPAILLGAEALDHRGPGAAGPVERPSRRSAQILAVRVAVRHWCNPCPAMLHRGIAKSPASHRQSHRA